MECIVTVPYDFFNPLPLKIYIPIPPRLFLFINLCYNQYQERQALETYLRNWFEKSPNGDFFLSSDYGLT